MTHPRLTRYACHRLIDVGGTVCGASVVSIDVHGEVAGIEPFRHEELPFTQWLGGTILLAHETTPPLRVGETLESLRPKATADIGYSPARHAWHTLLVDTDVPLASPLTLLGTAP